MKYNVSVLATTLINLGDFDANSIEEAYEKAMEKDNISHCINKVGKLTISNKDEDIYITEL